MPYLVRDCVPAVGDHRRAAGLPSFPVAAAESGRHVYASAFVAVGREAWRVSDFTIHVLSPQVADKR